MSYMIELLALLIMFSPLVIAIYFVVARYKLVSYLANNHPQLCEQLKVFNNTEIQGHSGKLATWLSTKSYAEIGDNHLVPKAESYKKARMLMLLSSVASVTTMVFLSNANI